MATHEVECGPGTNTLLPTPSPTDRDEDFWVSSYGKVIYEALLIDH